MENKFKVPALSFLVFLCVGLVVWMIRDIRYFFLFGGIGMAEFITRSFINFYPKYRQFFRIFTQCLIGGFLLFWLSLVIGVNFQFPQIFFDASAFVVTGALIQLLIARIILPFILGNAFCSRACWTGAFFELTNKKKKYKKPPMKRSEWLAWGYLVFLVVLSLGVAFFHNPATDDNARKIWIIGENVFIMSLGLILSFFTGSRSYCRLLCPFLTISGLFSRFSIFKITPVNAQDCTQCNICNNECPMLIDVKNAAKNSLKVDDKLCIVCERCVSACPNDVLKLTNKGI